MNAFHIHLLLVRANHYVLWRRSACAGRLVNLLQKEQIMFTRAILGIAAFSAAAACVGLAVTSAPKAVAAVPAVVPAVIPAAAPAAVMTEAPAAMKFPLCLRGFSKDSCDGVMYPGYATTEGCDPGGCKTLFVQGATLGLNLVRNETQCSEDGKCDECPEKDGTLKVKMDYLVRLNFPCPYRGCLEGKGELSCRDGSVFSGEFHGTMGVGSHRKFSCLEYRTCYCENCNDVDLVEHSTWRIGWEASFHGTRVDRDTGEQVCFTMSGDFYLSGDGNGVYDFNQAFKVKNTADGTFGTYCN